MGCGVGCSAVAVGRLRLSLFLFFFFAQAFAVLSVPGSCSLGGVVGCFGVGVRLWPWSVLVLGRGGLAAAAGGVLRGLVVGAGVEAGEAPGSSLIYYSLLGC